MIRMSAAAWLRKCTVIFAAPFLMAGCAATGSESKTACEKGYAAQKAAEIKTIKSGEDVLRRIIKGELAEEDATPEEIAAVDRMEAVQESRTRPVDASDVVILERAGEILSGEDVWDRNDDRKCAGTDTTFSLFCALHNASIEILGTYEHRRTSLQEVRFAIEEARPGVEYDHRLMDFNNAPDTTLADIRAVLETALGRGRDRLALQENCAL